MTARSDKRRATVERNTKETRIRVEVDLDGTGHCQIASGIGFFDHMLDQVARHGMLDLVVDAHGDLHIDGHHTIEDIGITFGQALAQAVGDKAGVRRYGHAYVPLDEALSRVVIDLSGRPSLEWNVAVQARDDRRIRRRSGARVLPGLCQPCAGHAACRQLCAATTPITSARRSSRPSPARCAWQSSPTRAPPARFPQRRGRCSR